MAYVRSKLEEDEAAPQGSTTLSSGAGASSSGPGTPTAPQTPVGTGMPDLLAYVRANQDQAQAAGAQKASELEGRGKDVVSGALTGKDQAGNDVDVYGSAESLRDDLGATTTQEGREALFGDPGASRGGKSLDAYLVGQSGMDPLNGVREQYSDLLGKVEPYQAAPSSEPGKKSADDLRTFDSDATKYNEYLGRRNEWSGGTDAPAPTYTGEANTLNANPFANGEKYKGKTGDEAYYAWLADMQNGSGY
jgi:hypothetical protein